MDVGGIAAAAEAAKAGPLSSLKRGTKHKRHTLGAYSGITGSNNVEALVPGNDPSMEAWRFFFLYGLCSEGKGSPKPQVRKTEEKCQAPGSYLLPHAIGLCEPRGAIQRAFSLGSQSFPRAECTFLRLSSPPPFQGITRPP